MRGKFLVRLSRTEAIVMLIFLLFSLRVLSWFQYPYIWISGDLRSPLVNEALVRRFFYLWDEVDFGMPSVYPPRLLNPFLLLNTLLQTLGISLPFSQVISVFLIYFFSSVLMYVLVKNLTDGDMIASFIASVYLSSNVYLVNDREISAISFMTNALLILLPLTTFVKGIKSGSVKVMALSGVLSILSHADFPNYRTSVLYLFLIFSLLVFLMIERRCRYSFLNLVRLIVVFGLFYMLVSSIILTLAFLNYDVFVRTYATVPKSVIIGDIRFFDVARLIVEWGFYSGALNKPYIPYRDTYINNPTIIFLSYMPILLAFTSLLLRKEKITLYFSFLAIISLSLTLGLGFSEYGRSIYATLLEVPLFKVFRETSNWVFLLVISLSVLIGCATSSLYKKFGTVKSRLTVICLVVAVFLLTTYPLITGDVTRNWVDTRIKGALLSRSYYELNSVLLSDYWSLLLPQRYTYVTYNFSKGPLNVGNPYPLIFSKPVISGVGTEYIQSESIGLIEEVYKRVQGDVLQEETSKFLGMLGVKYLVLEKSFILGNRSSAGRLSALFRESRYLRLVKEWDEIDLFENAYALQRVYVADRVLVCENVADMFSFLRKLDWETLKHSAFVGSVSDVGSSDRMLSLPLEFSWREISPVRYEVTVRSSGPFLLVLLESYDEMWKAYVNGVQVSEASHVKVNIFANGWLIDATGPLSIVIQYEAQSLFERSILVSLISQALMLAYLCRRDLAIIVSKLLALYNRLPV